MQAHGRRISETADFGGENLGAVNVRNRTKANGPTCGIHKNRSNGGIGRITVTGANSAKLYSHIDVGYSLKNEACQKAASTSNPINQAPGEDHGDHQLDQTIRTRGYE